MTLHQIRPAPARHPSAPAISPVASDRIRALAIRVMEGAPALTAGEMRELAHAILDHNRLSDAVPAGRPATWASTL